MVVIMGGGGGGVVWRGTTVVPSVKFWGLRSRITCCITCCLKVSKILGNLSRDVFETRTATGRRKQMLLACSDLNQSVGKPFF